MKANPRTIVVKTLFNPDEFLAFDTECVNADISHSKQLRDLAKGWMTQRNDRRDQVQKEWPGRSQCKSIIFPSRASRGHAYMRC